MEKMGTIFYIILASLTGMTELEFSAIMLQMLKKFSILQVFFLKKENKQKQCLKS